MSRNFTKPIVFVLAAAVLFTFSYGREYTLPELIELIDANNLLLRVADLEGRITRQEYRAARQLPAPELEYSRGSGELPEAAEERRLWSLGLTLSLPNPLYRHYLLKARKGRVDAEEVKKEILARDIVKGLKCHFYQLQLNRKIREFLMQRRQSLEEIGRITRAKADIGEAREIDVLRSRVEVQKIGSELFKIDNAVSVARVRIGEILNFAIPENFAIVEDFGFSPLPDIDNRLRILIEQSLPVKLKRNHTSVKGDELKAGRSSFIESIHLFGEREKEVDARVWRLGVGLTIPIFNNRSPVIRQARLEKEKAEAELLQTRNALYGFARHLTARLRVLEREIRTYEGAVLKEGQENVAISERLYRAGEIPLVVLLDAQRSFFELRERYYQALTEWKILRAELTALLGE